MRTANYTDLRKNLKRYLDSVIDDSETVIINREGNEAVVMISLEEYNALKETGYLMQSPTMIKAIRQGISDIEEGRIVRQKPDESIAELLERL